MKFDMQGLGPGHIALDDDPALGAQPSNFQPSCCGQMAGWIKMALGMVGLGQATLC